MKKLVPFLQRVSEHTTKVSHGSRTIYQFYMYFPNLSLHWKEGGRHILAKGSGRGISTKDYALLCAFMRKASSAPGWASERTMKPKHRSNTVVLQ